MREKKEEEGWMAGEVDGWMGLLVCVCVGGVWCPATVLYCTRSI